MPPKNAKTKTVTGGAGTKKATTKVAVKKKASAINNLMQQVTGKKPEASVMQNLDGSGGDKKHERVGRLTTNGQVPGIPSPIQQTQTPPTQQQLLGGVPPPFGAPDPYPPPMIPPPTIGGQPSKNASSYEMAGVQIQQAIVQGGQGPVKMSQERIGMPPDIPKKYSEEVTKEKKTAKDDSGSESEKKKGFDDGVENWSKQVLKMGIEGLKKEYKEIPNECPVEKCPGFKDNPTKNRYHNMPCFEGTRFRMDDDPQYYIHANYVSSAKHKNRFLCTQAPLNSTVEDFWRMIVESKTEFIIMLCDLFEKGKQKSAEYFPKNVNDVKTVPNYFKITKTATKIIKGEKNLTEATFRIVRIGDENMVHTIKHIHWHLWPDHGAPDNFQAPFKIIAATRNSRRPIVVHCSAGIGRTGTMVLIALILESLRQPEFPGVPKLLAKLREERFKAVQTEIQYLYIHRCVIELLRLKKIAKHNPGEYIKFKDDYEEVAEKYEKAEANK